MKYQTFSNQPGSEFPIAILAAKLSATDMMREYLDPISMDPEKVIAYELHKTGKKTSVTTQREYLDELIPILDDLKSDYLIVGDSEYFKTLTGVSKSDMFLGYVLPNVYPEHLAGRFQVILVPNYRQVFYNPGPTRAKIKQGLEAFWTHQNGRYEEPGKDIIHFSAYPQTVTDIAAWLGKLIDMDCDLAADIEGFSLKHHSAGIGTISFAWSEHEGIAFPVDLGENPKAVRKLLIKFFKEFKRNIKWHNISYDVYVLIYQLFMEDLIDTEGLLNGMDILLKNWDDTKLITYLATNTCAGNKLSLKEQAQEFAGNYAVEEIKDIRKIPLPELLEYNLVDTLSTWYTYKKHWNTLVQDQQLDIYENLFKPAIWDIIQMQLTGMPVNKDRVRIATEVLEIDRNNALSKIHNHPLIQDFTKVLNEAWVVKRNSELKVKRVSLADAKEEFNPNSNPQLVKLLYEHLELPVIEKTATKQPATGGEVLEKLKAYTDYPSVKQLIDALLDFGQVEKIYGTFIPPLRDAVEAPDGCFYVYGSFNLGGTLSGRLSSSGPNLQQIPARGRYAKLIKDCFRPPKGWIMVGLDFDSLEDRISALTTRDPNKLKVYTDGYDGHCLRAHSYFQDQMPDIDPDSVDSINSIKKKYPDLRQASKTPTFLLTYGGTSIGMVAKCDFTEAVAKEIEHRYHELYKVSDEWVQKKLDEASQTGFVTVAFGLRVRTPLLAQVIRGTGATPHEAEREGRSAGNALGQSYCLLNTRASIDFLRKVRAGKHRLDIRPLAHIHDAQYFLIRDDIDLIQYVNKHLVEAVQWQDDPEIWHESVKLGGELSLFHPSWAYEKPLPNDASPREIFCAVEEHLETLKEKEDVND